MVPDSQMGDPGCQKIEDLQSAMEQINGLFDQGRFWGSLMPRIDLTDLQHRDFAFGFHARRREEGAQDGLPGGELRRPGVPSRRCWGFASTETSWACHCSPA